MDLQHKGMLAFGGVHRPAPFGALRFPNSERYHPKSASFEYRFLWTGQNFMASMPVVGESSSNNYLFFWHPCGRHPMEDTDLCDSAELRLHVKHKQPTPFRELVKPRECVIVDLDGAPIRKV
jgi:hypothetical protein